MSGKDQSMKQYEGAKSHTYEGFWGKSCLVLGIIHVLIGVASMIMNGVGIHFHAYMHNYAQGIWSGIIFFVSGFVGVVAGYLRTPIPVKATMVMSIISAVVTIPMMGITAAGLDHDRRQGFNYWVKDPYTGIDYLDGKNDVREAAHAILLTLSLVELGLAVLSTLICVHGVFYCDTYKGAHQTPGQAMLFPKSSSPVSHEAPVVEASELPDKDVPDMYPKIGSQPPRSANPDSNTSRNTRADVEYSKADKKGPPSMYPSQPSWKAGSEHKPGEGGPPVIVGATGSSAFQPLHSLPAGPKPPSHAGSHNTSTSSFTPLHMIPPNPRHNMSTSSSEMYPGPRKTSSRSSTPAGGGYYGGQDHQGGYGGGGHAQRPSSRSSKSSYQDHPAGHQPGAYQYGNRQQRRI